MFDSCFSSGTVLFRGDATPPAIDRNIALQVRQFITAGDAKEQVPDQSIFRKQLEYALRDGLGDTDKDRYVSGTELGLYLYNTVSNYSKKSQNPQHGKLREPTLDKGDFIFAVGTKSPLVTQQPAPIVVVPQPAVQPTPVPAPVPAPSATTGNLTVTSEIAGEKLIGGKGTGRNIHANRSETLTNMTPGPTEVAVKEPDGTIVNAPMISVRQGQTVEAVIDRPIPEGLAFQIVDKKSIEITKYTRKATTVILPNRIHGLPVTTIKNSAFQNCSSLTSISMPLTVTEIGRYAFSGCKSLPSITMPRMLTSIGSDAFNGCSSINSIDIPNSVASISDSAFAGCYNLKTATYSRQTTLGKNVFPTGVKHNRN